MDRIKKICDVCGAGYAGATRRARFCSDRCRQIAHRAARVTERGAGPLIQPQLARSVTPAEVKAAAEAIARTTTNLRWHTHLQFRLADVDGTEAQLSRLMAEATELLKLEGQYRSREFDWTALKIADWLAKGYRRGSELAAEAGARAGEGEG